MVPQRVASDEFLLSKVADDTETGGPSWDVLVETAGDPLSSATALRLMGAMHRLVLAGELPELARFYPSVGGRVELDGAWAALRKAFAERTGEIRDGLRQPVQTNEVGRSAALVGGFLTVAKATGLPLRTLEIGASAGLNSRWDRYLYEARGATWGDDSSPVRLCEFNSEQPLPFDVSTQVVDRGASDQNPIDVTTREGELRLTSFVWADQVHRIRLLREAVQVARAVPLEVERASAVEWLGPRLGEPVTGVSTVVFHSIVMQYLSDDDRKRYTDTVQEAGERATPEAPLAWMTMEGASEDEAHVHLKLWPGGKQKLIATSGYHGHNVRWLGW